MHPLTSFSFLNYPIQTHIYISILNVKEHKDKNSKKVICAMTKKVISIPEFYSENKGEMYVAYNMCL